jgi:hypothetical protein
MVPLSSSMKKNNNRIMMMMKITKKLLPPPHPKPLDIVITPLIYLIEGGVYRRRWHL